MITPSGRCATHAGRPPELGTQRVHHPRGREHHGLRPAARLQPPGHAWAHHQGEAVWPLLGVAGPLLGVRWFGPCWECGRGLCATGLLCCIRARRKQVVSSSSTDVAGVVPSDITQASRLGVPSLSARLRLGRPRARVLRASLSATATLHASQVDSGSTLTFSSGTNALSSSTGTPSTMAVTFPSTPTQVGAARQGFAKPSACLLS